MNTECICIILLHDKYVCLLKMTNQPKNLSSCCSNSKLLWLSCFFLWNNYVFSPEIIFIPFNDILSYISVYVFHSHSYSYFMNYPFKDASIYYV